MGILEKIRANQDYKRLFENFISLSILQGLNYILPLITFLHRAPIKLKLKNKNIGSNGQCYNIVDYLVLGAWLSPKLRHRRNMLKIFSAVMTIKFGLMFLSLIYL